VLPGEALSVPFKYNLSTTCLIMFVVNPLCGLA
jgi:hypothetical protein